MAAATEDTTLAPAKTPSRSLRIVGALYFFRVFKAAHLPVETSGPSLRGWRWQRMYRLVAPEPQPRFLHLFASFCRSCSILITCRSPAGEPGLGPGVPCCAHGTGLIRRAPVILVTRHRGFWDRTTDSAAEAGQPCCSIAGDCKGLLKDSMKIPASPLATVSFWCAVVPPRRIRVQHWLVL